MYSEIIRSRTSLVGELPSTREVLVSVRNFKLKVGALMR